MTRSAVAELAVAGLVLLTGCASTHDLAHALDQRRQLAQAEGKLCDLDSLFWARSFVARPRGVADPRLGECLALLG